MKKRALSVLLTVLLMLSLTVPALADGDKTSTVTVSTLIEPTYEDAKAFSDGLAAVKKDGKWGYIDETGKVVIDFKYDFAGGFNDGLALAAVCREETDGQGTEWEYTTTICSLIVLHSDGTEKKCMKLSYNYDTELEEYREVIFDLHTDEGETARELVETALSSDYFYEGVLALYSDELREYSVYGEDGKEIRPNETDLEGVADKVKSKMLEESGGLEIQNFGLQYHNGYQAIYATGGVCVDGNIPMVAYYYGSYETESDDEWGEWHGMEYCVAFFMDKTGHITRDFVEYSGNGDNGEDYLTQVCPTRDGLLLASKATAAVHAYPDGSGTYVDYTYSTGMMDENGNWKVQPTVSGWRYQLDGTYFPDGLWIVRDENDKYGAVDMNGKQVIPYAYDFLDCFNEGLSQVSRDGEWFYIDTYGNRYDVALPGGGTATELAIAGNFSDLGVAVVYDKALGKGYLVTDTPVNGVLPAIEGSEGIALNAFIPGFDGTVESIHRTTAPKEIVPFEQDGKYGYYKLTFDLVGQNPFTDVLPGAYYFDEVVWAANEKIVDTAVEEFKPETDCPRWQVVDSLWRAAGCPEPTLTRSPFTDVAPTDSFYKAVLWAYENGIARGNSATTFGPNETVLRCDALTFLHRAAGEPVTEQGTDFTDVPEDAYYMKAISWAVSQETPIAGGIGNGLFDPENEVIKCDMMILLYRTVEENNIDVTAGVSG